MQDIKLYLLYITPLFFWSLSKLYLLDDTLKSIQNNINLKLLPYIAPVIILVLD